MECLETTEAWTRGEKTMADVRAARFAAAYAAYAAAAAAATAATAANAARSRTQKECAKLVRKHIPWSLISKALKDQTK